MRPKGLFALPVTVLIFLIIACQVDKIIPPEIEKIPITDEIIWTTIQKDQNIRFQTIHFDPSGTFGMAYSLDGPGYVTRDGGNTWQSFNLTESLGQAARFSHVTIADTRIAWMNAYKENRLFFGLTEDAGNSWTFKEFPYTSEFQVPSVIRPNNKAIYVFESASLAFEWPPWYRKRTMYVSLDGGTSWSQISTPEYIMDIAATSPGTMIAAVTSDSTRYAVSSLLISNDNGASWKASLIDTLWYFHTVHFATQTEGIAVGARYRTDIDSTRLTQAVFRTSDGGNTWSKTYELSIPWRGVYFFSRTTAWIRLASPPVWILDIFYQYTGSGGQNIDRYRSNDNGQTWIFLENLRGYYYEPAFAPPDWKIGIRGNQLTQDGGQTWQLKQWFITRAIFPNPYEVFAVRDSLILLGTAVEY